MPAESIACAGCSQPVPAEFWNRDEPARCRGCERNLLVAAFPALRGTRAGEAPQSLTSESEASCFYHPQSRAAMVCEECGRFLCALCDLEVEGRHICPRCFEAGVGAEKIETSVVRRTMYDSMALLIATVPAVAIWPSVVSAPWALFLVFRRWNAPSSVVPRTKIRFLLAALFALAELGFLGFLVYMILEVTSRGPRR